jgi:MFS family permease
VPGSYASLASRFFKRYFAEGPAPNVDEVRGDIWSSNADQLHNGEQSKEYSLALLEQYKIYVEMADRISARRGLTNTFFLTLNSAIFTLIGAFLTTHPHEASWLLIFPLIVLLGQCLAWFWLVRSYRQLNAAKYAVVGAFEERLPASPYWRAEWKALGQGEDPSRYWPLSHLEQWIPALFAISYLGGFIAVLLA